MRKRIIIVGCGRGMMFARILEHDMKRQVAAIAENDLSRHPSIRKQLAEWGMDDVPIFDSLDKALAAIPRSQADIVFVMTPDWTHLEILRKAVAAGCHIFLEKPVETTREKILDILKLVRSSEKLVQVGFVLRYSAFVRKVKEIADSGMLGCIAMIQMNERLSLQHGGMMSCRSWHRKIANTGGFLNEKCSHDLDLMCWFKSGQAEPKEVFSCGGRHITPPKDTPETCGECKKTYCPWNKSNSNCVFHSDGDIMDHQVVNIRFSDDTQGVFTVVSMSPTPGRDIRIFGSDGYLEGELEQGIIRMKNYWEDSGLKEIPLGATDAHGGGDTRILAEFMECIEHHERPLSTVADGAQASLIALAAQKSADTGTVVSVSRDMKMLASIRNQDRIASGKRNFLKGEAFDENLLLKMGSRVKNGFVFMAANPSSWPIEVALRIKADSLAVVGMEVAKESPGIENGITRISLAAHESRECRLTGRACKISGSSLTVAPDKANELKSMAMYKIGLYKRINSMSDDELSRFVAAINFDKQAGVLRELCNSIISFAEREDWLAVANKTSAYSMMQLEKNLELISAERRNTPVPAKMSITCGSETSFIDKSGQKWLAAQPWLGGLLPWGYIGGNQVQRGDIQIIGAEEPRVYQNEQYGLVGYRFRVPNGNYNLRLHFVETWNSQTGQRRFNVAVQEITVLKSLDVLNESGGKFKPLIKEFSACVKDGVLAIDFAPPSEALVNGIELERL